MAVKRGRSWFGARGVKLMKPPEAARSVAAPGPCKPAHRTRCCTLRKQQAAMFDTVGDGPRLVRASPLTGQGVAPFGNNRRPCLKPSETGRASTVASLLNGQGVAPI
ncbi:MAG: hypothetical protein LBD24_07845 [Spirochaetaceae bacterium]|nr:hypothetical protein [Spirochaetaceae bacterium]